MSKRQWPKPKNQAEVWLYIAFFCLVIAGFILTVPGFSSGNWLPWFLLGIVILLVFLAVLYIKSR